jgi:hypothetical protein
MLVDRVGDETRRDVGEAEREEVAFFLLIYGKIYIRVFFIL